jgi:DNA repair photolyase
MSPVHNLSCKSALNKLKRSEPYGWDLNPYRGCQPGCVYCYARYSHQYLGQTDFVRDIYVKDGIGEVLERELSSPKWKGQIINIGGVTDAYQPLEKTKELMPEILRICLKHENPIIISTKSSLILRDLELLSALADKTYVNVAVSVTTCDEELSRVLEPGASPVDERFEVLRAFRDTQCSRGLHLMPILPYLTDSTENLEGIFSAAKEAEVDYALCGTLYLRGQTKDQFLAWLKEYKPSHFVDYLRLYYHGSLDKLYKNELYKRVGHLRETYGVGSDYASVMRERLSDDR